jgi:hypothetical protein
MLRWGIHTTRTYGARGLPLHRPALTPAVAHLLGIEGEQ